MSTLARTSSRRATYNEVVGDDAASNGLRSGERRAMWRSAANHGRRATRRELTMNSGVPNKPMVPTATGVLWIKKRYCDERTTVFEPRTGRTKTRPGLR